MPINPSFTGTQTIIFSLLLLFTLIASVRLTTPEFKLTKSITSELKGLAILMIVFGHIGYFLSTDHNFLWPLSIASGLGVNIFLFLSGFGLTKSSLQKRLSVWEFYKKRVFRLFLPLWIIISTYYLLDFFILHQTYPAISIIHSYLGFFPDSNIYAVLNSPLWYFSLILFYYLIYPLLFIGPFKFILPLTIYLATYLALNYLKLPVTESTLKLYAVHNISFPLGIFFALLDQYSEKLTFFRNLDFSGLLLNKSLLSHFLILILLVVFGYYAIYSGVGTTLKLEQHTSIFLLLVAITIFLLKNFKLNFLSFYGDYSYGIYLIHWPLLFRYDLLYKSIPAFLATFIYLYLFLFLAIWLQKITDGQLKHLHSG